MATTRADTAGTTDALPHRAPRAGATPRSDAAWRRERKDKLVTYARTGDQDLRAQVVEAHLGLAKYLARRFADRGHDLDDLAQVAAEALCKAVDRFDPDRGIEFSTFATHTISGELKRHLRDRGWAVRAPRRLQELYLNLGWATSSLSQSLGRSPTIAELATETNTTEEQVLEAQEAGQAYRFSSLDTPGGDEEEPEVPPASVGEEDPEFAGAEDRATLAGLLGDLPPREARIVHLRFFEGLTQSAIGARLGISQMHVSRLLSRALDRLRARAGDQSSPVRDLRAAV